MNLPSAELPPRYSGVSSALVLLSHPLIQLKGENTAGGLICTLVERWS